MYSDVFLPVSRSYGAVLLLVLFLLAGCDTQEQQDEFAADASLPPSGFTETTAGGEFTEQDEDDWRTAPAYFGAVRVEPAFPNPATTGDLVSIPITIFPSDRAPARLELRARDSAGDCCIPIGQPLELQGTGTYGFTFPTEALPLRALQRVFIFDEIGELVSYGDILVE